MPALLDRVGLGLCRLAWSGLDVLLPPECPVCRRVVDGPDRLCAPCFGGMSFITAPLCLCCGLAFATVAEAGPGGLCFSCIRQPRHFRRARAALRYDGASQPLILPFKHADRTELAAVLAGMMARAGAALLAETDVLLPVPLHRRRLISRRYNQAALLTAALARRAARPWLPHALMRPHETVPLGELSAAARREAVDGAFAVRARQQPLIAGRRLLLIDDVITSGATASACAAALLAAGAAAVDVLAAARVPAPMQDEQGSPKAARPLLPRRRDDPISTARKPEPDDA